MRVCIFLQKAKQKLNGFQVKNKYCIYYFTFVSVLLTTSHIYGGGQGHGLLFLSEGLKED